MTCSKKLVKFRFCRKHNRYEGRYKGSQITFADLKAMEKWVDFMGVHAQVTQTERQERVIVEMWPYSST